MQFNYPIFCALHAIDQNGISRVTSEEHYSFISNIAHEMFFDNDFFVQINVQESILKYLLDNTTKYYSRLKYLLPGMQLYL